MKTSKPKRYKVTIQYFDPETREMGAIDTLKSIPMTEAEWGMALARRLHEASLESKHFCYTVGTHRDVTIGARAPWR